MAGSVQLGDHGRQKDLEFLGEGPAEEDKRDLKFTVKPVLTSHSKLMALSFTLDGFTYT